MEEVCKVEHLGRTMYITPEAEDLNNVNWDQLWSDLKGDEEDSEEDDDDEEEDNDFGSDTTEEEENEEEK